jgi:hypothetical protein
LCEFILGGRMFSQSEFAFALYFRRIPLFGPHLFVLFRYDFDAVDDEGLDLSRVNETQIGRVGISDSRSVNHQDEFSFLKFTRNLPWV